MCQHLLVTAGTNPLISAGLVVIVSLRQQGMERKSEHHHVARRGREDHLEGSLNGSCLGQGPKTKVFHHRTPGPRLPTAGKPSSRGRRPPEAPGALGQPCPVSPSVPPSVRQYSLLGRSIGPSVSQSAFSPSAGPAGRPLASPLPLLHPLLSPSVPPARRLLASSVGRQPAPSPRAGRSGRPPVIAVTPDPLPSASLRSLDALSPPSGRPRSRACALGAGGGGV